MKTILFNFTGLLFIHIFYIGENRKGEKFIGTAIVTKVGELKQ